MTSEPPLATVAIIVASDIGEIERFSGDPCLIVGAQGVHQLSRRQLGPLTAASEFKLKSYKVDESSLTFRELAPGVAAIAYRLRQDYDRQGRKVSSEMYNTSIWVKRGNAWECPVHTETLVEPPK